MPSSVQSVNLDSAFITAAGTNSGYRPHGRRRTRSTTCRLRSGGSSYGFSFWSSLTSASKCLSVYAVRPRTSGLMAADGDGSRMSSQSFSNRELCDHCSEFASHASRISNSASTLQEIRQAQRRKEPRRAGGCLYVARPCEILGHDGGRLASKQDGAGIYNPVGYLLRFGHQYFHVFGGDMIHQIDSVILGRDDENSSSVHNRDTRNRAAVQNI